LQTAETKKIWREGKIAATRAFQPFMYFGRKKIMPSISPCNITPFACSSRDQHQLKAGVPKFSTKLT
jgi:hypothetical protein